MIPVPVYPAVEAADQWLVEVLGFVERVRIGPGHRAQLSFGVGSLIVAEVGNDRVAPLGEQASESAMLRVADVAATWNTSSIGAVRSSRRRATTPKASASAPSATLVDTAGH